MLRATIAAKPLGLISLVAATFLATGCDDVIGVNGFEAEEPFSFAVEVTTQLLVTLSGVNGAIEFVGVAGFDSVRIEGVRRVASSSLADAEAHLADLEVVVDARTDEIGVHTEQPSSSGGRTYVVDYQVTMPSDLLVRVENANGEIRVESIDNTVRVQVANGRVLLADIVGSIFVQTGNGAIECVATLPVDGAMGLQTGNGNIDLFIPASTSAEFSATVGNGRISIASLTLQNQTVTSNHVTGRLGAGEGEIGLITGNGNITVVGF